jgi:hypothetical protein
MTCGELRDHYELYALGIAEEPEASEIRAHLDRACPTCVPGVRAARELTATIGASVPSAEPPARLRKRVLAAAGGQPAKIWTALPWWVAAAAAILIAVVVFTNQAQRGELARLRAQESSQTAELARLNEAMAILNQPDAKQVVFGGATPQPPRGRVFLDPHRGVLLIASNLPPVPAGKTYEMWVIPKATGKPVRAGLFQSAADGTAINVQPGPVDVSSIVAVTVEPAGGMDQPTSTPILAAGT